MTGYYSLSSELRQLLDDKVFDNISIDVMKQIMLPVIPDLMVQRAHPEEPSEYTMEQVKLLLPSYINGFFQRAPIYWDRDGIGVNKAARGFVNMLLETVEESYIDSLTLALQHAALMDIYIRLRLQEHGLPYDVMPANTGAAFVGGIALGGVLGYLFNPRKRR